MTIRYRPTLDALESRQLFANYFVALTGDDANPGTLDQPFRTIQHALDLADNPGDVIQVRGGTYKEKIHFPASGDGSGMISLEAYPGDRPLLSGRGVQGQHMVLMENVSYVRISGFEIAFNLRVTDGSGIRVLGAGSHLEIVDNVIHDMRGKNAMGITVYGTSTDAAVTELLIQRNEIFKCQAAKSEALTLNGNVDGFQILNNNVHDINNIGIDMIGGEAEINPLFVTRNGVVRGNTVYRCRSVYGGGFAAGIYVDGGKDILIENNHSYLNNVGIEVGAENPGITASNVTVQNNLIYWNGKTGLGFGGYDVNRGRVDNCRFINNTIFENDQSRRGFSQIEVAYASNCLVANNIVVAGKRNRLLASFGGSVNNTFDYNLWIAPGGVNDITMSLNGVYFGTFADYQNGTGQDAHSLFADPLFLDAASADFHLQSGSPAIDAGDSTPSSFAQTDFDGQNRPMGTGVDMGALEYVPS